MPFDALEVFEPPVKEGLRTLSAGGRDSGLNVVDPLTLLFELGPLPRPKPGDVRDFPGDMFPVPVVEGLSGPPAPRFGPMVVGKLDGFTVFATRLKAPRHCSTCAGSLDSYKSTVKNLSCEGMLSGGCSQARRKCEMFSICMNGIGDFLNLTPGFGIARLTSLHLQISIHIHTMILRDEM